MTFSRQRRTVLLAAAIPLAGRAAPATQSAAFIGEAARIEAASGGRLGIAALDLETGARLGYRAAERFPMCSTFKAVVAGAVLARSAKEGAFLDKRLHFGADELLPWAPVAKQHLADGMTVRQMCAAIVEHSDNTASNCLVRELGGPAAVTAFARSIGDDSFRLDRRERRGGDDDLNTATPGDERDTTTPLAMLETLRELALGERLPPAQRALLQQWLVNCQTGLTRIRASVPAGWKAGDKTGTGHYGSTNDIAVIWPPGRQPMLVTAYYTGTSKDARSRPDVLADAARAVLAQVGAAAGRG